MSLKRIQAFLSHEELDPNAIDRKNTAQGNINTDPSLIVVCLSLARNSEQPFHFIRFLTAMLQYSIMWTR